MEQGKPSKSDHNDNEDIPRIYSIAELNGLSTSTRREFLTNAIKVIGAGGAALLTSQLLACEPTPTSPEETAVAPKEPTKLTAVILEISPNPAHVDDLVRFRGTAANPSAKVTKYSWSIEGHGQIGSQESFETDESSFLTREPGVYTVVFKVKSEDGVWSAPAIETITVLPQEASPTPVAVIMEISPNPANVGDIVSFEGSNSNPSINITEYLWSIEECDLTVSRDSFQTSTVTREPGTYTVVFKVKSEDDVWSDPVTKTLTVLQGEGGEVCTCDTVCTCVGHCTCDAVCTCQAQGGTICTCDMVHYWYPN